MLSNTRDMFFAIIAKIYISNLNAKLKNMFTYNSILNKDIYFYSPLKLMNKIPYRKTSLLCFLYLKN